MNNHETAMQMFHDLTEFCKDHDVNLIGCIASPSIIKREKRNYYFSGSESTLRGMILFLEDELVANIMDDIDEIDLDDD